MIACLCGKQAINHKKSELKLKYIKIISSTCRDKRHKMKKLG